jgi:hypothetical protein
LELAKLAGGTEQSRPSRSRRLFGRSIHSGKLVVNGFRCLGESPRDDGRHVGLFVGGDFDF